MRAALRACGCRNALTPFEIASMPVSAAEPEAKARSRTKNVTAPAPAGIASGVVATGHVRERALADAGAHHREVGEDEEIRGNRERDARLAHAAEVDDRDQDDGGDRELDDPAAQRRHGGRDREDAGGDRDGDREDVVDEERGRGNEARDPPRFSFETTYEPPLVE